MATYSDHPRLALVTAGDLRTHCERLINYWTSQAKELQEAAIHTPINDRGIRYAEKAAGLRQARTDLQAVLDMTREKVK